MNVSIIIPNYNHTRFVRQAIESALNQTIRPQEIIIVDDGSTDNSREVVTSYGDKVHYIWQENQGLAGARNTGIKAAESEYVGLLDADDIWLPEYLEKMLALANQHPDGAVFYCTAQAMDENGQPLPQVFGGPVLPSEAIYGKILRANYLIPSTILLRRSTAMEAGLFDQHLRSCEDWDLWLRLLPGHKFYGSQERLVRYRVHGASLSTNPEGMQRAATSVIEKNFGLGRGDPKAWSEAERRAHGGLYRYILLLTIQRQRDWVKAADYLRMALSRDPSLAVDVDMFYELALGDQPVGYRGSPANISVAENATLIEQLIERTFDSMPSADATQLIRRARGTANLAIGLVAYNTGSRALSRKYLAKALFYRPGMIRQKLIWQNIIKSFFKRELLQGVQEMWA